MADGALLGELVEQFAQGVITESDLGSLVWGTALHESVDGSVYMAYLPLPIQDRLCLEVHPALPHLQFVFHVFHQVISLCFVFVIGVFVELSAVL